MPCRTLIFLGIFGFVAGCATPPGDQEKLADACQLKPCVCLESDAGAFSTPDSKPPLWTESGKAHCPAGYHLSLDDSGR